MGKNKLGFSPKMLRDSARSFEVRMPRFTNASHENYLNKYSNDWMKASAAFLANPEKIFNTKRAGCIIN